MWKLQISGQRATFSQVRHFSVLNTVLCTFKEGTLILQFLELPNSFYHSVWGVGLNLSED